MSREYKHAEAVSSVRESQKSQTHVCTNTMTAEVLPCVCADRAVFIWSFNQRLQLVTICVHVCSFVLFDNIWYLKNKHFQNYWWVVSCLFFVLLEHLAVQWDDSASSGSFQFDTPDELTWMNSVGVTSGERQTAQVGRSRNTWKVERNR